jgi:hypothetical protein
MAEKWIQAAREEMERKGTVGSYGHHSARQQKRDIAKGGKRGKKALFAANMRKAAAKRKKRGRGKSKSRSGGRR